MTDPVGVLVSFLSSEMMHEKSFRGFALLSIHLLSRNFLLKVKSTHMSQGERASLPFTSKQEIH